VAARAVVVLCAVTLLASGALASPDAVTATEIGDQISNGRRSQAYFESVMLAQDAAIARIKGQSHLTHRALKQARRAVTQSKHALRDARQGVGERSRRLAELEALQAGMPFELIPEDFADRVNSARRELAKAKNRRVHIGQHLRTAIRQRHARQYRLGVLKRQRSAAISRRESAEGGLGAYIVELTRLAQLRAENQSDVRLTTTTGFTWPSVGRISQTYGCTGYRLNPRRGSCAHFHDGLDIVAGYGSRVASVADGVVAYAGWNPWDEGGRAWLMVVSHPDGYVTRYGHLLPGPLARVGQFVRQGEAIGKMGNTGRSTGTHLHFELLQSGTTVSPWSYLPAGMVTVKGPRHAERRGHDKGKDGRHGARSRTSTKRDPDRGAARRPGRDRDDRTGKRTAADGGRGAPGLEVAVADATQVSVAPDNGAPTDAAPLDPSAMSDARPFSESLVDTEASVCLSPLDVPGEADAMAAGRSGPSSDAVGSDAVSRPDEVADRCAVVRPAEASAASVRDSAPADRTAEREGSGAPLAAVQRDLGVPQPDRGTSPVPA
jgi:murein DD-endopeptidase MepM/ murein hydrolase activator NlpD